MDRIPWRVETECSSWSSCYPLQRSIGTLRKDDENADVNLKGLGRDVAVVVVVVGHFFLTVRNVKN